MSHSSSLHRQGHIELNLKTLLQGIPVGRLGFDPTQIPANVSTQLPVALIQPQLVSGRVDVSLRDVIDGCHERYRPAFAKASMDERITLPVDTVREQLPPSGAVLSPSEAESPFKPAGQGFRSPFAAADSPRSGEASPFKPASQSSASPFSPAGDTDEEEPAEAKLPLRAPEAGSNSPFAAPAKPVASSPFSPARSHSTPGASPFSPEEATAKADASPFKPAASGSVTSPFTPAASEGAPSSSSSTSPPDSSPSPFTPASPGQGSVRSPFAPASSNAPGTATPSNAQETRPKPGTSPFAPASAETTPSAGPGGEVSADALPEEGEDELSASASSTSTASEAEDFTSETMDAPDEDDVESSSKDGDEPLTLVADDKKSSFKTTEPVKSKSSSPDQREEASDTSEHGPEDDRKPLSPFAMPPGSAKPRRKADEDAEALAKSAGEREPAASETEKADAGASDSAPPSWPSGLRDQNGVKNGRHSPPPETAASPAPAKPAFDFGFQDDPKQLAIRAIFETAETLEVGEILDRTASFRSLSACALIVKKTGETKFGHGADSNRDERFAQQAKQAYKKVIGLAEDLAITDAESFTLRTNRGAISFFNAPHVCLAVLHDQYEFPPGIKERLILIVRDLSSMEA